MKLYIRTYRCIRSSVKSTQVTVTCEVTVTLFARNSYQGQHIVSLEGGGK
jgi:hypothetical protein